LDTPAGVALARVAGLALVALAVACWLARHDSQSRAGRGVLVAMFIYNAGAATMLAYGGMGLGLSGIGLWPAVLLHAALTAWCLVCLRSSRVAFAARPSFLSPPNVLAFAFIAAAATGCSGINASKSISPLDFILPGLTEHCPPAPALPIQTNTVPLLAQGSPVQL
jgi:hypothetical protein